MIAKAFLLVLVACFSFAQKKNESSNWQILNNAKFYLKFTQHDAPSAKYIYEELNKGLTEVEDCFKLAFKNKFDVYVFSSRNDLNDEWRKSWGVPDFNSECWMVASGVAKRLDILSPSVWKTEACEHNAEDSVHVYKIFTHELVHVFHGQINPVPDFAGMDDMGWFVEGLAVLVSGQLTSSKISDLHEAKTKNALPAQLKNAWNGKYRYVISGSLVQFIEKKWGRKIILELMKCTNNEACLNLLQTSEADLLATWKNSI